MKDKVEYGKWTEEEVKAFLEDIYSTDRHMSNVVTQTDGFFTLLFHHLLDEIKGELNNASILDWGCGSGIGAYRIKQMFNNAIVEGRDISSEAIKFANDNYSKLDIMFSDKILDDEKFDIIINSNCLEHFLNNVEIVEKHLKYNVNKYYIILVPYKGRIVNKISDHISTIDENTFPEKLGDATRITSKVVFSTPYKCWTGYQLLIVYKKEMKK